MGKAMWHYVQFDIVFELQHRYMMTYTIELNHAVLGERFRSVRSGLKVAVVDCKEAD